MENVPSVLRSSLRKHAYSNILKILTNKTGKFSEKNSDIFHISAQNINYGYLIEPPRRGGSNENPQSMFLCRNKKNNLFPCKPQFYYIKVGVKGSKLYMYVFVMSSLHFVPLEGCPLWFWHFLGLFTYMSRTKSYIYMCYYVALHYNIYIKIAKVAVSDNEIYGCIKGRLGINL